MSILIKNSDFNFKKVKGETVMLNSDTGDYFGLNEVGTDFIALVDGKRDLSDIIKELQNLYDVDAEILEKDIRELAGKMLEKNILIKKGK